MNASALPLPADYLRRLLTRGVLLWLLTHLALLVLALVASSGSMREATNSARSITLPGALLTGAIVACLSFVESGIRRERIFAANLGVSLAWLTFVPAVIAITLDALVGIGSAAL